MHGNAEATGGVVTVGSGVAVDDVLADSDGVGVVGLNPGAHPVRRMVVAIIATPHNPRCVLLRMMSPLGEFCRCYAHPHPEVGISALVVSALRICRVRHGR